MRSASVELMSTGEVAKTGHSSKSKSLLHMVFECVIFALIVCLADFFGILFLTQQSRPIIADMSFLMLIEGGLALLIGGGVASFSSIGGRMREAILRSKPWTPQSQREAERQGRYWILTGALLVLDALLISAL